MTARAALALAALGLSTTDVWEDLSYERLKGAFREKMTRDPIDSLLVVIAGCSYLFWLAERDDNPKCSSFPDALEFVTTNLSVGYCDIFAMTEAGKAIAAFVMTVGPALAAAAFDPPKAEPARGTRERGVPEEEALEVNRAILGRLDAILEALQRPA